MHIHKLVFKVLEVLQIRENTVNKHQKHQYFALIWLVIIIACAYFILFVFSRKCLQQITRTRNNRLPILLFLLQKILDRLRVSYLCIPFSNTEHYIFISFQIPDWLYAIRQVLLKTILRLYFLYLVKPSFLYSLYGGRTNN